LRGDRPLPPGGGREAGARGEAPRRARLGWLVLRAVGRVGRAGHLTELTWGRRDRLREAVKGRVTRKTSGVDGPETRYARSGEGSVASQVMGAGSVEVVYVRAVSQHVELNWENPPMSRFLERLGSLGRLIVFDKRGTGMSDRVVGAPTLEVR